MIVENSEVRLYSVQLPLEHGQVDISVSKYSNALTIIINQEQPIGSMLESSLRGEGHNYEIRVLYGEANPVLYESLFNHILAQLNKLYLGSEHMPLIVSMFIALPVNRMDFAQGSYFNQISRTLMKELPLLMAA